MTSITKGLWDKLPIDRKYSSFLALPSLFLEVVDSSFPTLRDQLPTFPKTPIMSIDCSKVLNLLKGRRFNREAWKILDPLINGKLRTMRRFRFEDSIRLLYRRSRVGYDYFKLIVPYFANNYSRMTLTAAFLALVSADLLHYLMRSNLLCCDDTTLLKRYKDNVILFKELAALNNSFLPLVELSTLVGFYFSDTNNVDWLAEAEDAVVHPEVQKNLIRHDEYTTTFQQEADILFNEVKLSTVNNNIGSSRDWVNSFYFPTTGSSNQRAKIMLSFNGEDEDFKVKLTKAQWNYVLERDYIYELGLSHDKPVYSCIKKEEIGKVRLVSQADDTTYLTALYTFEKLNFCYKQWYPIFVGGSDQDEINLYSNMLKLSASGHYFLPFDSQNHDHQIRTSDILTCADLIVRLCHINSFYDPYIDQYYNRASGGELVFDLDGQSGSVPVKTGLLSGRIDTTYQGSVFELLMTRRAKRLISAQPVLEAIRGDDYVAAFQDLRAAIEMRVALAYIGLVGRDSKFRITRNPEFLRKMVTKDRVVGYPTRSLISVFFSKPWSSGSNVPLSWLKSGSEALLTTSRRLLFSFDEYLAIFKILFSGLSKSIRNAACLSPVLGGLGLTLPFNTANKNFVVTTPKMMTKPVDWISELYTKRLTSHGLPVQHDYLQRGIASVFYSAFSSNHSKINALVVKQNKEELFSLSFSPLTFTDGFLHIDTITFLQTRLKYAHTSRISDLESIFKLQPNEYFPFGSKLSALPSFQLASQFCAPEILRNIRSDLLAGFNKKLASAFVLDILFGKIHTLHVPHPSLAKHISRVAFSDIKKRFKLSRFLNCVHNFDTFTLSQLLASSTMQVGKLIMDSDWFKTYLGW